MISENFTVAELCPFQEKKRILYIITQGILGGPRTHINHLVAHLNPHFEINVAVGAKDCMDEYITGSIVPVYKIHSLVRPISLINDIKATMEIVSLIKKIKPDIISTHSSKAGILGRIAAYICHVPVIFTAHGWAFTEGVSEAKRRIYILLERLVARLAGKIICVSEHDRQLALEYRVGKPEQLVTIQNAMPFNPSNPLANPGKENPVRLIMVARFCEQKDHQLLFQALSKIKVSKDYVVDLAGDGPLMEECLNLAQSLGLNGHINFLGPRTDVPELLLNAQIFLLISKWEGFPRSILEAMRAGLPIIASDVGGTNEMVIDGENGFLIPRGDLETLISRIQLCIEDSELRIKLAKSGNGYFVQNFTFDNLLKKTLPVYFEVIKNAELAKNITIYRQSGHGESYK